MNRRIVIDGTPFYAGPQTIDETKLVGLFNISSGVRAYHTIYAKWPGGSPLITRRMDIEKIICPHDPRIAPQLLVFRVTNQFGQFEIATDYTNWWEVKWPSQDPPHHGCIIEYLDNEMVYLTLTTSDREAMGEIAYIQYAA